jgi:hypothetical protein
VGVYEAPSSAVSGPCTNASKRFYEESSVLMKQVRLREVKNLVKTHTAAGSGI